MRKYSINLIYFDTVSINLHESKNNNQRQTLGSQDSEYENYGVVGQFYGQKSEFREALVSF